MKKTEYQFKDGILTIELRADNEILDFSAITEAVKASAGIKVLNVDMRNCLYIQSKSLAELVALKKLSTANKFEIGLLNVVDAVYQILDMSNLLSLFEIRDDYSAFSLSELSEKFLDDVDAMAVSDYLSLNYNEDIRQKLISVIDEGDPIKMEYAILTMGRAQDYSCIEIFRKALKSNYPNVTRSAILVLGWVGDTASKDSLYGYITDNDIDVAEAAAASIALLSDGTDSEKMHNYLLNMDYRVRKIAVQALSLINDDKGYKYLCAQLKLEKNENVRVILAKRLSLFNREGVAEVLIKLLDDDSMAVREAAASGIVRIGPKNYVEPILAKVCDSDNWVGYFAAKALAGVCDDHITAKLIEFYPSVEQNVKLAIIEVLGHGNSLAIKFLSSKLADENEDIRKEALNALFTINPDIAVKEAMKLYNTDSSWLVRYKSVDIILTKKPVGYDALLRIRLAKEDNRYVREKLLNAVGERS